MFDRRNFLGSAVAASISHPVGAQALKAVPLPAADLHGRDEDAYWKALRAQFLIPSDVVNLNVGTVGSSPRPVLKAIFDGFAQTEQMTQPGSEDYPIWGYGSWDQYRRPFADFMGARVEQMAILRNCTEANSYVANGCDMKAGDEVLISDEEHGSGEMPWMLRSRRYGVVVKKFAMPKPPKDAAEILNRINDAITPRTRIIFVSHISTSTGVVLPAKEIAALARSKGIVSAFDGAHAPGMIKVDLNDIGCDLYTGSMHKWLFATKGTGFLYLRDKSIMDRVWNTIATGGYDDPTRMADRYMQIGSSCIPTLMGLNAAVDLANNIGMDRIEARGRMLCDYIHAEMMKRGAEDWTSPDPALRGAIATVNVPPVQRMELQDWLWTHHKVRIRGGNPSKLRLATPYFLSKADIDRFLGLYDEFRKIKGIA
ncbi:aminotransferase class V-fold PLP-dependent enzyme [Sphingobium limneticum]|uniref:Aminotransferase class V-fold PLP-dependent enzyme n=1 Tax=Sphingobium limneticum TaxID=1007511 RepID=A0A5J5HZ96_9SPHN|nr:aminotransferase class V-fold PLP-dependent enzyme [Sphingobium limneticum]KAA9014296.1 aminotransferase class V-fold PLP-dependent enzyme [Sphingobium limneticum]KAA9027385.1 aminotransferase class V-fold PLP-dependent enzyme [Sphingobium limneticum]